MAGFSSAIWVSDEQPAGSCAAASIANLPKLEDSAESAEVPAYASVSLH